MTEVPFIKNNLLRYDRLYKLLFWCSVAVILLLALTPRGLELTACTSDKINHAIAFFVLGFLSHRAYTKNYRSVLVSILIFGFLIEMIQHLLPYRDFSLFDMLSNTAGVAAYLLLNQLIKIITGHRAP